MGRNKIDDTLKRKPRNICMTDAAYKRWQRRARACGMTVSAYLNDLIMGRVPVWKERK
jgi:hypothetical protein